MKQLLSCISVITASWILISGCSTSNYKATSEEAYNKTWVLKSINGADPANSIRVTIKLIPDNSKQGRVSGRGYCNCYFGEYNAENKLLAFTPLESTKMSCNNFLMHKKEII